MPRERPAEGKAIETLGKNQQPHITLTRLHTIKRKADLPSLILSSANHWNKQRKAIRLEENITLVDRESEAIILQKISPSSYSKMLDTRYSGDEGNKLLYDAYLSKKIPAWTAKKDPRPTSTRSRSQRGKLSSITLYLALSRQRLARLHKRNHQCSIQTRSSRLLAWANKHIKLVLATAADSIHPSFHHNLKTRSKGRRWLVSIFGKRSVELLHPFSTTLAFFLLELCWWHHVDEQTAYPRCLFNFGEPAWIKLPEFSVKLLVEPLDLVILNSRTFYHRTGLSTPRLKLVGDGLSVLSFERGSISRTCLSDCRVETRCCLWRLIIEGPGSRYSVLCPLCVEASADPFGRSRQFGQKGEISLSGARNPALDPQILLRLKICLTAQGCVALSWSPPETRLGRVSFDFLTQ